MNSILEVIDITTVTLGRALALMGTSLLFSLAIALVYVFTHRRTGWRPSILMTMFILGPVVSIIVICIGSNIARAISIGGGLALVRFRNTVEDPRDLIYLYLSLASGMACGVGFIGFGAIGVGLILLTIVIISLLGLDRFGGKGKHLRILIPESLDYDGVFEPILKQYCKGFHLNRVRTEDYGTLLRLDYQIVMKDDKQEKALLDAVRTRNGNLNVTLTTTSVEEQ